MKGEFDSPSKPATDAYREGWEKTFGNSEYLHGLPFVVGDWVPINTGSYCGIARGVVIDPDCPENVVRIVTDKQCIRITNLAYPNAPYRVVTRQGYTTPALKAAAYPNGCPILEE